MPMRIERLLHNRQIAATYYFCILESKGRTGRRETKESSILNDVIPCFSCPNASVALQNGGFGPREWLVTNGPINANFHFDSIRMSRCSCKQLYFTLEVNPVIFASYVNVKTVFFRSILSLVRFFFKLSAVFRIIVSTLPLGRGGHLRKFLIQKPCI